MKHQSLPLKRFALLTGSILFLGLSAMGQNAKLYVKKAPTLLPNECQTAPLAGTNATGDSFI